MVKKIILFASGNGSNAERICHFFRQNSTVSISGIFTNNPKAGIIKRAKKFEIEVQVFDKKEFIENQLLKKVAALKPDLIVLAEASFTNDLGADSLDTVELIMEFEKEFDIQIPDDQAENIATVGQAIQFIEQAD